ncbi:TIGR04552 family protein [Pseudocolwellia sp. AS88]|jgi:uncharacterized protein (TIGR04562 family)|uniref:TIGR04552 family protein n=1 Tax=Pseudocolwellia TaxID=2848177 RepID=UPI0026E91FB9|nr:TIGR04552 family protein [Pseudocolwellia sp. AS88]MDO7085488.1 TIGR04552 family protein [Pseudocolwellia sp. AS88]
MHINPWRSASVRAALNGLSFIDEKRIHIHSLQEAHDFIESYGFDLDDAADVDELEDLRQEAIKLIQEELLTKDEVIPDVLLKQKDIRQYLVNASGHGDRCLAPWSAAILRIIHTLSHSHSYLNDLYHLPIREQIFNRFNKHIVRNKHGCFLGDIKLDALNFREAKSRRSVALKLLHKVENVAADIFDWIGIRFITEHKADVLDVLTYLRQKHIITYANLKPSRSRNNLIDLAWIDKCLAKGMSTDEIRIAMQTTHLPSSELSSRNNQAENASNPFSGINYKSVQITCRHRIKIKHDNGEKMSFFFPFEIQLMDRKSYRNTREGLASHSEYKKRQKEAIRRRVLPFLSFN